MHENLNNAISIPLLSSVYTKEPLNNGSIDCSDVSYQWKNWIKSWSNVSGLDSSTVRWRKESNDIYLVQVAGGAIKLMNQIALEDFLNHREKHREKLTPL